MTKAQCYQCRDKQHNLSKATYKKYQGDCENRRLHDISKRVNCFSVYCGLQTGKKATVSLLLVIQPNNNLFQTCFEFLDLKNVVKKSVFTLFAISCASVTTFGGFIFCGEPFDNIHLLFEKIISSGPEIESTAKVFMSF